MTNWLTAAGLALFAGGLATLICFRAVLFGGGGRRARRGRRPADQRTTGRRASDRRASARRATETPRRRQNAGKPATVEPRRRRADDHGGLASIGFADDEVPVDEVPVDEVDYLDDDPEPPTVLDRSPRRVGHRAEGWVRPEYRDVQPAAAGDYWTPPPSEPDEESFRDREPSARGYGWPVQVERLPPVPGYEPATGFDRQPVPSEPTEVVPAWSAGDERADRPHLPRSWSARDDKPRRRPRPRPRPTASVDGNGVYVSRHAADPPR